MVAALFGSRKVLFCLVYGRRQLCGIRLCIQWENQRGTRQMVTIIFCYLKQLHFLIKQGLIIIIFNNSNK